MDGGQRRLPREERRHPIDDWATIRENAPGKNLYVFGSADLSATLIRENLFDEYRLCVVPVLLGAGTALFKSSSERKRMKLRETRTLESGGVILFCEPDRK
jgi:dihydrofolate reductase